MAGIVKQPLSDNISKLNCFDDNSRSFELVSIPKISSNDDDNQHIDLLKPR